MDQEKALALLGAVLSPGTTIASLAMGKMMPPRDEFENSVFSRMVTDPQGNPKRNEMGEMEILPQEVSEGAFWKKGSPMLPRFLKPETKLSPTTQQRLAEEIFRMVQKAPNETRQRNMAKAAIEFNSKLPSAKGESITGADITKAAKESGSQSKTKGEVNGLRLLQRALANKSIYHGYKTNEGRNVLWQEAFKGPKEAKEVRDAMVDRRVTKGVATPEEKQEYDLRMNAQRDPMEAMMETLRMRGKMPPKIEGGSGKSDRRYLGADGREYNKKGNTVFDIPIKDIHPPSLVPPIDPKVIAYRKLLKEGSEPPPVELRYDITSGKFQNVDGSHRLAALGMEKRPYTKAFFYNEDKIPQDVLKSLLERYLKTSK